MASDSSSKLVLLNHLADEFAARYRKGERPSLQEYVDRYPELADDIREFFPALVEVEQVKEERHDAESPPAAGPLPPLERLGDYRIIREVGRGGMGVVYEAEQVSLGRHVALKVLPQRLLADPRTRRRFEREAKAAARLHHTNIVPVFGVGEHDGLPYYVMQFIRGLGLDEVLEELKHLQPGPAGGGSAPRLTGELRAARKDVAAADVARSLLTGHFAPAAAEGDAPAGPTAATIDDAPADRAPPVAGRLSDSFSLSSTVLRGSARRAGKRQPSYWQSVARVGVQVAEALAYAHGQGVLHRDVKPSNLLLDTAGTVWVADFGLAKADDQQNLTHTGDVLGTLRYLPPEAFDGKADARGDVYSLGLTLYELLAFRPAFEERERNKLIKQVTGEEPPRLDRLNAQVPRDLVTIVHKAIERDPAHRYPTAGELAADLQRFLDDEPIQARPMPAWERGWRWAKRRPAAAALFLVSGLAVLTAVGGIESLFYIRRLEEEKANTARALEAEADQRRKAEQYQYFNLIARAHADWQNSNPIRGLTLLRECPPDLRGWEWYYLKRLYEAPLLTLPTHQDDGAVAFSPDGSRLAASGPDQTIKVWDVGTGKEVFTLRGHRKGGTMNYRQGVNGLAFSRDGRWLASAGGDTTVRIWNMETGAVERVLEGHTRLVMAVAFHPDGARLASASWDGRAIVWKLATGERLHEFRHQRWSWNAVTFSPDGARLAVASAYSGTIVWDMETRDRLLTLQTPAASAGHSGLAFRPDGGHLATAEWGDGTVGIWDAKTGKRVRTLTGHTDHLVFSVAFSPDGTRLASAGGDGTVRIWDSATGKELLNLRAHGSEVYSVAWSADGARLASQSWDGTVKVWDVTGNPGVLSLAAPRGSTRPAFASAGPTTHLAFSPEGAVLASRGAANSIVLRDMAIGHVLHTFAGHTDQVTSVAFSPDGQRLASASKDGTARIWNRKPGQVLRTLKHTREVCAVAFSADGARLGSAEVDGEVKVWDTTKGALLFSLAGPAKDVRSIAFDPKVELAAWAGADMTIRVWDLASGRQVLLLEGHTNGIRRVAFSPDGARLASASDDHTTRVWDRKTGAVVRVLSGHMRQVFEVAFNRDGTRLATLGVDATLRIWDVATGHELLALKVPAQLPLSSQLVFSPDGTRLVAGRPDGGLVVWDARPGTKEVRAEREAVGLVQFLFAKPLPKDSVIAAVRRSRSISEPVRDRALALVECFAADPRPGNKVSPKDEPNK